MNNNNELFKAGTYYVGDLCYIFDGSDWDALLEKNKFFEIPAVDFKENKVGLKLKTNAISWISISIIRFPTFTIKNQ